MERASLVRIVAYFWHRQGVPANRLLLGQPAFAESIVATANALTASQVDFVIRHELGHVVLDHAGKLRDLDGDPAVQVALRHETWCSRWSAGRRVERRNAILLQACTIPTSSVGRRRKLEPASGRW